MAPSSSWPVPLNNSVEPLQDDWRPPRQLAKTAACLNRQAAAQWRGSPPTPAATGSNLIEADLTIKQTRPN